MYSIVSGEKLSDKQIYDAFSYCFSDYMISMQLEQDVFISRFFGCEGNDRKLSFIAYEDENPVGVCLGGLKTDEEVKTLRCGGMAVAASARGKGLAGKLMELHRQKAKEIGCKQLFLEVIVGNDRAIAFYKKNGYEKVYNLTLRKLSNDVICKFASNTDIYNMVESITYEEARDFRQREKSHLPWQFSFDYFKDLDMKYYGIKQDGMLVATIVANENRVSYLYIDSTYRNKGYGKALIHKVISVFNPKELLFAYTNNHYAHTFANHIGMECHDISQLEMYQELI